MSKSSELKYKYNLPREVFDYLEKLENVEQQIRDSAEALTLCWSEKRELEQQNKELRELLEYLDFCGGLGLDKHRMIKEKLDKYK